MQTDEGPSPSAAQSVGDHLFRHRSYTLVPLAVLIAAAVWLDSPAVMTPGHWLVSAAAVVLLGLGETLRMSVAARALPGTSGRGTTLRAATLITTGAYAWTRNPLYLANSLLWLGAGLLTLNPWVVVVVAVVIGLQYHFIILTEEHFLIERFGQAYSDYCCAVPRFFPSVVAKGRKGTVPFSQGENWDSPRGENWDSPRGWDWPKAIFREHDTIYLIFLALWLVLLRRSAPGTLVAWSTLLGAATLLWLATKWIKKTRRHRNSDLCRSGCA